MATITDRGNNQYVVHLPHADLFVDREQLRALVTEGAEVLRIPLGGTPTREVAAPDRLVLRFVMEPQEIVLVMAILRDSLGISLKEAKEIVLGTTERWTNSDEVGLLNQALIRQELDTRATMEHA